MAEVKTFWPVMADGRLHPTVAEVRLANDIAAEEYHDKVMADINESREIRGLEPLVRPFVREHRGEEDKRWRKL